MKPVPILCFCCIACTAVGPPFRDAPSGDPAPVSGTYAFAPPLPLYRRSLLGETSLERAPQIPGRTYFAMRIVGRNADGSIRMRSYEGRARRFGDVLELRSRRCYEFGKRDWTERLSPLERWDCDHLFFQFKSDDDFRSRGILGGVQSPRTARSDWLGRIELVPLPFPRAKNDGKPGAYFAGQLLHKLEDGRWIVWGRRAGRLLRDGQKLIVLDSPIQKKEGENERADAADKKDAAANEGADAANKGADAADKKDTAANEGAVAADKKADTPPAKRRIGNEKTDRRRTFRRPRRIGILVVEERPGDFLITRWQTAPAKPARAGMAAYTNTPPPRPGWFD